MSAVLFEQFRRRLAVQNSEDISISYKEITKLLNRDYWEIESDRSNCLQVGSYGRNTAIHGVSDLDMVFALPESVYIRLSKVAGNGPSQLFQEVRDKIKNRYPTTSVRGDGQVVVVEFSRYRVEVLPAFYNKTENSYTYGDSNNGGRWLLCYPNDEMEALNSQNQVTNRNLKRVCKMLRAWKQYAGVPMSGFLIDTLAYNFFRQNASYNDKSYGSYPELVKEVFTYLSGLPKQAYWLAPGSKQRADTKGNFQRKASKAAGKCQEALGTDNEKIKEKRWRSVFGRNFPTLITENSKIKGYLNYKNTEEFIDDRYPMDIQYDLEIDCEVSDEGKSETSLLKRMFYWLPQGKQLKFYITVCDVPEPFSVIWKVRNVGEIAKKKNQIRGQLLDDDGSRSKIESSTFHGPHFVECFIIKNDYCVARDRIDVPIEES